MIKIEGRLRDKIDKYQDRFWSRMEKTAGCWVWSGMTNQDGYGIVKFRHQKQVYVVMAHHLAYFYTNSHPGKLHVCHHCDHPPCINPSHLYVGTNQDNMTDRNNKNRTARGEENGQAKLTETKVLQIRQCARDNPLLSLRAIAQKFNISKSAASSVIHYQTWTAPHLDIGPITICRKRKISPKNLVEIRRRNKIGEPIMKIAEDFGITLQHTYRLLREKKHES